MQDGEEAEEAANLLEGILGRLPNRAAERIVSLPVPPAFLCQTQSDPRQPHLCWLSRGAITTSQLRQVGLGLAHLVSNSCDKMWNTLLCTPESAIQVCSGNGIGSCMLMAQPPSVSPVA